MIEPKLEPNSPKTLLKCSMCKGDICEDERYIRTTEGDICFYCAEDMPLEELLKTLDVEVITAGRSEFDYGFE